MDTTVIISIFSALGIGGFIGAYVKHRLDKNREFDLKLNQINEEKYQTLLMYMSFMLDPKNREHFIMRDEKLNNLKDDEVFSYSKRKVEEYFYHCILYASDDVLITLKIFVKKPDRNGFLKVVKAMRMGLWNKGTKLTLADMLLE